MRAENFKPLIFGAGGQAHELFNWSNLENPVFFSEEAKEGDLIVISRFMEEPKTFHVVNDIKKSGCNVFNIAIGDPKVRERFWNLAIEHGLEPFGVMLPDGFAAPGVRISGSTQIGKCVILNMNCTIGHHVILEDFVTVSPGAHISGRAVIKKGATVASGACVREGLTVGEGAFVGMNAVVTKDVPAGQIWVGSPAKELYKGKRNADYLANL